MNTTNTNPCHILYTITTRPKGSSWETTEVYAVRGGMLEHVAHARYQPGASAGRDHECRTAYAKAWDTSDPVDQRWEVREINAIL